MAPRYQSIATVLVTLALACQMTNAKPTKEVELSTELDIKRDPLQEDIDQFFKDQDHLQPSMQNTSTTDTSSPASLPSFANIGSQIMSGGLPDIGSIFEQLGMSSFEPTQVGYLIISGPLGIIAQFMNSSRVDQID